MAEESDKEDVAFPIFWTREEIEHGKFGMGIYLKVVKQHPKCEKNDHVIKVIEGMIEELNNPLQMDKMIDA